MSTVVLTLLYVPADRVERVRGAMGGEADVVIIDLEDAVAPQGKDAARTGVPDLIAAYPDRPVQVRVNHTSTPWGVDDLAMVADLPQHVGVRLPKVVAPADVAAAIEVVGQREMHCLLETAAGVEAVGEIARESGVASIALGEVDLRSDLGISDDDALSWCRQRLIVAARAAGLPAPSMGVYTDLTDSEGLAASTRRGRRQGYIGRSAIHPKQLSVIEAAFLPHPDEVERAHEVIASMEAAQSQGSGTSVLSDGSFVDVAMIEPARRVLALAERGQRR